MSGNDNASPLPDKQEDLSVDHARRRRLIKAVLAGVPTLITLRSGALLAAQSSGGACLTVGDYSIGPAGAETRCVHGDGLGAYGSQGGGGPPYTLIATDPRGVIGDVGGTYTTINSASGQPGRWKMRREADFGIDLNGDLDTNDACILYVNAQFGDIGAIGDKFGAGGVAGGPPAAGYYPMTASCWGSVWTK